MNTAVKVTHLRKYTAASLDHFGMNAHGLLGGLNKKAQKQQ